MRKVLDVLRLVHDQGRSQREIAKSLALSQSTVSEYLRRFRESDLPWPIPAELDEQAIEARLFQQPALPETSSRPLPDWPTVHREMKRKGVTLQLLWLEYKQGAPDGYQYTQFCRYYHAWLSKVDPVLRQVHKAGERVFVDYAGPTVSVADPATGEVREAQVFVAAMGASHLLYVEATWTQSLPDWIASHVRMLEYFGGVPELIVPDNLKSGVTHASFYEPELNATYQDLAAHYGTAILPTRVARPRDKAKVETAVLIAEREIMAPLRHHTFTALSEVNRALSERLEAVNERPFQKLVGSRRQLFETTERSTLRPLPGERYELAEWRVAKVNIDYHISIEGHLYSVPYTLVRATVRVRMTATTIEVLHEGKRVAAHPRSSVKGRFTTDPAHRPKAHQRHLEWSPSRLVQWGADIGSETAAVVEHILQSRPHPEMGYRTCLGLFSLSRRYGKRRLEAACARARTKGAVSYRSIKSILATGLDQAPTEEPPALALPREHAHVRGADYYRTLELPLAPLATATTTNGDISC
jgi:transposase